MGFPSTPHAPVAVLTADATRITAVEDRRADVVRAEVVPLPSNPTHGLRTTHGYYRTPAGTVAYYGGEGSNDWSLDLEEFDIDNPHPGLNDLYIFIAQSGGFSGFVVFDLDWPDGPGAVLYPGESYAPLAVVTVDNGPTGYTGSNATELATVVSIADARTWF